MVMLHQVLIVVLKLMTIIIYKIKEFGKDYHLDGNGNGDDLHDDSDDATNKELEKIKKVLTSRKHHFSTISQI